MLGGKIEISSEIDHFLKFDFPRLSSNVQSELNDFSAWKLSF